MQTYRAELDGMRAIAVLLVVAHHSAPELVPGGFIGVDVFFVLSGYLIGGIVLGELSEGRFSLLHFYERRARRILPALFLVLFVSAAFATFAMLPADLVRFLEAWRATVLFVSNLYFGRTLDYFDPGAETSLLLHTWSLSVEEQFYLVWPALLLGATAYQRRRGRRIDGALWFALLFVFVASLAFGIVFTGSNFVSVGELWRARLPQSHPGRALRPGARPGGRVSPHGHQRRAP